jgi:hypothetical protein
MVVSLSHRMYVVLWDNIFLIKRCSSLAIGGYLLGSLQHSLTITDSKRRKAPVVCAQTRTYVVQQPNHCSVLYQHQWEFW